MGQEVVIYMSQAIWVNQTKSTMSELTSHTLSFEEWEESYVKAAGGVTNSGYIAALQRTIASQADVWF